MATDDRTACLETIHEHGLDHPALQGFLEAAPDAIVVVDAAGRILVVNQLTEKMFGFARDELVGQSVEILVPDRCRDAHAGYRQGYAHDPRTRPMGAGKELAGRRKDGSEFPVEISLSPLASDAGKVVISIIRDLTARRQAEAKFRGLLESAPDGIVVVDSEGRIVIVNGEAERMFDYSRDELIGQKVEILIPGRLRNDHVGYRTGYSGAPRTRPMGAGRPLTGRKRDGTEFPVEVSLSPLETEQGMLVTSIVRDITDRRRAEEQIQASLREKEVLLKEIHHRVKNNLQVTSSLLKLQSARIRGRRAQEMFSESQNRIRSMALVHEKLYQSSDLSRIDLGGYVRSLARLLQRSYGVREDRIAVRVEAEPVFLSIEAAVPCGLVLNELLSNCIKHAFPDDRPGKIDVRVRRNEIGRVAIDVEDDGVGLPPEVEVESADTLGLQLVHTLTEQLRAELSVERNAGTTFRFAFAEAKP